jgi:hypothetical protein
MPCMLWILMIGMAMNMTLASFLWTMNAIGVHEQLEKIAFCRWNGAYVEFWGKRGWKFGWGNII